MFIIAIVVHTLIQPTEIKKMNTELEKELKAHVIDTLAQYDDDDTDFSELHYHAFNEDYYVIGYYQASEWLKKHDIDAFEATDTVIQYEKDNFGETNTKINSEAIVNMYVYIKGDELINSLNIDLDNCTKADILEALDK